MTDYAGLVERLEANTEYSIFREAATAIEELQQERDEARARRFRIRHATGHDHSTACSIWGDDGTGKTEERFPEPLPCNCGALENFQRDRAQKAEAQLARQQPVIEALAKSSSGFPLEHSAAADRCGIVVYFRTPAEADAALEKLGAISAPGEAIDTTDCGGLNRQARNPVGLPAARLGDKSVRAAQPPQAGCDGPQSPLSALDPGSETI